MCWLFSHYFSFTREQLWSAMRLSSLLLGPSACPVSWNTHCSAADNLLFTLACKYFLIHRSIYFLGRRETVFFFFPMLSFSDAEANCHCATQMKWFHHFGLLFFPLSVCLFLFLSFFPFYESSVSCLLTDRKSQTENCKRNEKALSLVLALISVWITIVWT